MNSVKMKTLLVHFEDFLIVDIGEGTTDLAVFRNKRFNPDFSYSVTFVDMVTC